MLLHCGFTHSQTQFESSWLLDESPKRKIRKFTISFSTEFFKPTFIKSFVAVGLALGILMFLCFPLTLLLILLHPEGMFYLCVVPYHSFPPALLLQPVFPSPLPSLSQWSTEPLRGVAAPRRCPSASAPTGIVPTDLPQILFSIYICFLATEASTSYKHNVWRRR